MASWSNFVPTFDERSIASRWVTGFASSAAADRFDSYMWTGIFSDNGWRIQEILIRNILPGDCKYFMSLNTESSWWYDAKSETNFFTALLPVIWRNRIPWLLSENQCGAFFQKYLYLLMGCTACSYFLTKTSLKHLYGIGYAHNKLVLES